MVNPTQIWVGGLFSLLERLGVAYYVLPWRNSPRGLCAASCLVRWSFHLPTYFSSHSFPKTKSSASIGRD